MKKTILTSLIAFIGLTAFSQTTITTPGVSINGIPERLPVFTAAKKIGSSSIGNNGIITNFYGGNNAFGGVDNNVYINSGGPASTSVFELKNTNYNNFIELNANANYAWIKIKSANGAQLDFYDNTNALNLRLNCAAPWSQYLQAAGEMNFTNISGTVFYKIKTSGVLNFSVVTNAAPTDGDFWFDGSHFYVRIAGVTKQLD